MAAYPGAVAIFNADRVLKHSPLAHLGSFAEAVSEGGGGGLQAAITKAGQRRALAELFRSAGSDAEKRAIIGHAGRGGVWMSANPCLVPIPDGAVVDEVCQLLFLSVAPAGAVTESHCLRCGTLQPRTGEHAHVCHGSQALQARAAEHAGAFVRAMQGTGFIVFKPGVDANGKTHQPNVAADCKALGLVPTAQATGNEAVDAYIEAGAVSIGVDFVAISNSCVATVAGALKKRGFTAAWAERAKFQKYIKLFSNLADKRHRLVFAAMEVFGTLGGLYNDLLRTIANFAVPQPFGYDIDGLRARCITRLRQHISAGVLRGNHKVLADWRAHSWSTVPPSAALVA